MKRAMIVFGIVFLVSATGAFASSIVIGGSSSTAPPPFWPLSFRALASSIDWAFPFTVPSGGPFLAEQAEVAAFYYAGLAGDQAVFTINSDNGGIPGAPLVQFDITSITTTPSVLSALPSVSAMLDSGSQYWFAGSTSSGQVNWNLGADSFGTAAYRQDGTWETLTGINISAFAVLGSPVPEPASLLLLGTGLAGIALAVWRRKK